MAEHTCVTVERHDWYTTITMDRAQRRNALSHEHLRELLDAFRDVAASDVAGVVLAGNGPAFSSGHDFGDMAGRGYGEVRDLLRTCAELMLLVQRVPQVVLARVHGHAWAAGCQLVASCDLAVAAEEATFAAPGGKGGWFCHTPMVAIGRSVPRKRALELALTGDAIDAVTAEAWGLVNAVVPAEELDGACLDLLRRATRGSRMSKALGKETLYAQLGMDLPQAYVYATEVMAAASQTADGQESMLSFLDKRPAKWLER